MTNRPQLRYLLLCAAVLALPAVSTADDAKASRPNILFCIADDWGWFHAGAYGDPVVKTPTFDRLAREGVLFNHAYVSSPSCTPSRNAILTGQWHWRLKEGANLWSTLRPEFRTYPDILAEAGYAVGHYRKSWGPGRWQVGGRETYPAGPRFKSFDAFLKSRNDAQPFCFWFGASDPHRPYKPGSGRAAGIDPAKIKLFPFFPDSPEIRNDVADYYFEVQRFDGDVGRAIALLEQRGELDNTVVVMTGDHGMPFPRCKGNVHDSGARVPLAVRWPKQVKAGRTIEDFVSLSDLAPTFLELAGVDIPEEMTGRSLLPVFKSKKQGRVDQERDYVLIGKERHVPAQEKPSMGGTPMRAIRTHDFLYIRNFEPERWPAGTPNWRNATLPGAWLADCDNGPTKTYIVEHQDDDAHHRRCYALCFGKRPAEELYDLSQDPHQINNVAADPKYAETKRQLSARLMKLLNATGDPRAVGRGEEFDEYPYYGGAPKHPDFRRKK